MKANPSYPGAIRRYLAASLLLSLLPLTGQTLVNGNFDAQTFGAFPGYASGNGGVITGWTLSPDTRVGLNTSGGPFAGGAGGTIPSAANVAFIQAGGTGAASISQTVTDLTIGVKYTVSVRVSARGGNAPSLVFSTDGTGPTVKLEVTQAGAAAAFKTAAFQFTATATSHLITFTNDRTADDHTLLLDDVTVAPAATTSSWSFAPWTGDADSGIDSQFVYSHAINFALNPPVTINGVNFIGREGGTPGRFTLSDLNAGFGNRVPNNVTGSSATLAKDFRYNGANTGITLQNLKPNTQYVFTAYGLAFDAAGVYRSSTFSSSVPGSDKFSVNLNHYGQGNGIRVNYTYTTDALGTPVAISYPTHGSGSWHTSAFSNREAVASTPPVLWTIQAWNDDATSGVSPNHVYTHAFKFGAATNFNLNGINFTGIAGGNPAGTNYSSANLGPVFANDTNNVTGFGSALARDFVYDGFPAVHNLSGLTPGKAYVCTLYSMGWDDGARPGAFIGALGEQMSILNQDQFGNNNGVRFEYAYTADASGTAKITVGGFDGTKSIHTYGISNRDADAMVGVAPLITLQPVGGSIGTGNNFQLRAGATGSATLSYQWKRGLTNVGTDSPVLLLEDVDALDAGSYTVVVTNAVTSVTSNPALLVVLDNIPGVFGTGLGVNGQPLPNGAVDPHYKLLANPNDPSSELAIVQSNVPGAWLANSATSKWIGPSADTAGAVGPAVNDGEGFGNYLYRTQIDLTGFDLATVQITGSWTSDNTTPAIRINGVATGLTNPNEGGFGTLIPFVLNLANVPGLIAGVNTVDFVVNNPAVGFTGLRVNISSAIGLIPANTAPHIAIQPAGGNARHNGSLTLAVAASGSAPLAYQWFKGLDALVGETGPTLVLDEVTPATVAAVAGDYKVVVSNGVLPAATSNVATVTVTNAIPVAVNDNLIATEDMPLVIDVASAMIVNDTDADGDTLTLATFAAASFNGGTVTETAGVITYKPAANFSGLDGFTYTVSDGWGGTSNTATVVINVSDVAEVPPGQLVLDIDLAGGSVTGTFTGTPGATYILQRSSTLVGLWDNVDTAVAPISGIVEVEDLSPPPLRAFYRISYTP